MKNMKIRRMGFGFFRYLVLAILMVWICFPFFWTLLSSFKPAEEIFAIRGGIWPSYFTLKNYIWVFNNMDFLLTLKNSLIVSIFTALFSVLICIMFAYSLNKYNYPGKKLLVNALIVSQMLPGVLIIIPIFVVFARLRLVNTLSGLVIAYSTFSLPFSVLMLRGYLNSLPQSLEEAALIDGCSRFGAFWRITFPLIMPGIIAVFLFCFILAWNDFLFALILTHDNEARTVAVQLYNIATVQFAAGQWGGIMAESIIFTIPVVVVFVILQKNLVEGLTGGAVKF